ncbi:MAG: LamG domain-containing protein [Methanolobus sp.]
MEPAGISSSQLTTLNSAGDWNLGEIISINTVILWNTTIDENDYVGVALLHTDSNTIIESGSLLGDRIAYESGSSGSGGGSGSNDTSSGGDLAWWKFNENSGIIAYDSVSGYHGTIFNAAWTTGVNESALGFDGSNDYVLVNDQIVNAYPFTVSAWIKTTGSDFDQAVVNLADSNTPDSYYGIRLSGGRAELIARNPITASITGVEVNDDQWHNIVAVFSSSTERILYVDGVPNGTDTSEVSFSNDTDRWSIGMWGIVLHPGTLEEVLMKSVSGTKFLTLLKFRTITKITIMEQLLRLIRL